MKREEIQQNETNFFINYTLSGRVDKKNFILETVNDLVRRIIDEKHLDEHLIRELNTHYTMEEQAVFLEMEYCKYNPEQLKAKPVKEQIHTVLIQIGYTECDIRDIYYREKDFHGWRKGWYANVYDKEHNETLRKFGRYQAREIIETKELIIKKVLGFRLNLSCY